MINMIINLNSFTKQQNLVWTKSKACTIIRGNFFILNQTSKFWTGLNLTLSKTSPGFCVCCTSLENTVCKEEIARNEQFLFFSQCFLLFCRTFCQFHKIQNCRLQTFSVWKSLKFVVWEKVKTFAEDKLKAV